MSPPFGWCSLHLPTAYTTVSTSCSSCCCSHRHCSGQILFDIRSETGSYDTTSEFTEAGLDEPSPRPHHQQQQHQTRGVPPGRDNCDDDDDDDTDWDEPVRSQHLQHFSFTLYTV